MTEQHVLVNEVERVASTAEHVPCLARSARAIEDLGQFGELDAGLPSALLVNRPDVLQAEQQLRAADADIGAARAAIFPRIALTGDLGFASAELGDLFKSSNQAWSVGGLVSLPIFDGGQRQAQLGVAQARHDELVALYQRTVQTAFSEVAEALIGRRRLQEQIAVQVSAVEAQRRLAWPSCATRTASRSTSKWSTPGAACFPPSSS